MVADRPISGPVGNDAQTVSASLNLKTPTASDKDTPSVTETLASSIKPPSTTGKRKRAAEKGLTYVSPKDKDFRDVILRANDMYIYDELQNLRPEDALPNNSSFDQNIISKTFLDIDNENAVKINSQMFRLHQRGYDETAITKVVVKYLAPFDDLVNPDGPNIVTSLCLDKWRVQRYGPAISEKHGHTYDWAIEPDMTYMATANIFDQDIRNALRTTDLKNYLAEPTGVCPYLTLEYKCTEKAGKDSDALNQMAVASVIWVHQRKQLKDALKTSDTHDLRHYSIRINATGFQIWVTNLEGKRYIIQMVGFGSLLSHDIETYAKWWNAIHAWGLGPNAQSFKRDIEELWGSMQGLDTSETNGWASDGAGNSDTGEIPTALADGAFEGSNNQPTENAKNPKTARLAKLKAANPKSPSTANSKKPNSANLGMTPPHSVRRTQTGR